MAGRDRGLAVDAGDGHTRPVTTDEPRRQEPGLPARLPLYVGGALGPFGTMVIVPMFPELRSRFGVDSTTVSLGFSAYLLPMAILLLVSGTIGERFGRQRVLRIALLVYAIASVMVAMAPDFTTFIAARAVQGAGNAFFTPLLVAGLAEITHPARLGGQIGIYTSFQAVGGAVAPFAGGVSAAIDWRLAYLATAVVTAVIALVVPPGEPRPATDRPPVRPLFTLRLGALGLAALAAAAGPLGANVLVGFKSRDLLDMDPSSAGLLLAGGSIGAAVLSPWFGRLVDRFGPLRCGVGGTLLVSASVAGMGWADNRWSLAVGYLIAGSLFSLVVVVIQQVGASAVPRNRGGALSAVMAFRFAGHALGPVIWVPLFASSPRLAFVGAGLLGLVTAAAFGYGIGSTRSVPMVAAR